MKRSIILFVSLIILFNQDAYTQSQRSVKSDTLISNYLSEINADSIRSTMQALQDMGTRYSLANNRKDVAMWIRDKFISFGYNNAFLDSFEVYLNDTTMQYNVVATLDGTTTPDVYYIVGGHHDSYSGPNSILLSPGADDNASGVAATIEIARVLKKINFQSPSSIRFLTFAYEEGAGAGSEYYTNKAVSANQDIRMMINFDMISNTSTPGQWTINIQKYDNSSWVTALARYISLNYSTLLINEGTQYISMSDSYSFYSHGFQTILLTEYEFSNYYHTIGDTIGNCDMLYCAEITKVACGMLLLQSIHPEVMNMKAYQSGMDIKVIWDKSKESNVTGYNLYRSLDPLSGFTRINSSTIDLNDTVYTDITPTPLTYYFYAATTVDSMQNEGEVFRYDSAMVLTLNRGVFIVDDSRLEDLYPTDSAVDNFYDSLLYAYHPHQYDVIDSGGASLSEIGKYSTVVWHTDKYTTLSKFFASEGIIKMYLTSGGNLLLTTDKFGRTTDNDPSAAQGYPIGSFNYNYLHCDSTYRNLTSRFYAAQSLSSGYPNIEIDTTKTLSTNNHHLSNIESIYKRNDANYIYSYDSQYDSTSAQGNMKGLPVGYEYLGNDYKLIVLSFPLWYMRFDDAKSFMDYAMEYVFNESVNVPELSSDFGNTVLFPCYPNPFSATTTVKYYLSESDNVQLAIYDITGNLISDLVNRSQSSGVYTCVINSENLNNGIYFCTLKTSKCSQTTKLVLIK